MTRRPEAFAMASVVRPIEEVPPRISRVSPASTPSPVCSDPWHVCSISGRAPNASQGRSVSTGKTLDAENTRKPHGRRLADPREPLGTIEPEGPHLDQYLIRCRLRARKVFENQRRRPAGLMESPCFHLSYVQL